jgi:UDP:flavonoid glycosyltransferase YjiC (YdhE family)
MGYYGILAPAYTGHLNPLSVLGRSLQRRGHRIAVIAPRDAEAKVLASGLEFLPIATAEYPLGMGAESGATRG